MALRAKATTGPHPGPLPGSHRTAVALPTPSHHPGPARSALRCPLKHRQLFGATRPQRRAPGSGYSLVSPLGAPVIAVSIETEGVIRSASIAGQPLDLRDYAPAADGEIRFGYAAIPPEGIEVTLSVAADAPISVTLAETSYGLPTVPGLTVSPRLADTMPASGLPLDATIVRLSMTI